jgi:hypothetical protein
MQLERKREADARGLVAEDDPRTIPDDRGNYAIMHAIARGNNSMAVLLDAYVPTSDCIESKSIAMSYCLIRMFMKTMFKYI